MSKKTNNGVTEYKIDKNIPMPPRRHSPLQAIVKQLEVGDSFELPAGKYARAYNIARVNGFRLANRKAEDGMVRAWRIK